MDEIVAIRDLTTGTVYHGACFPGDGTEDLQTLDWTAVRREMYYTWCDACGGRMLESPKEVRV